MATTRNVSSSAFNVAITVNDNYFYGEQLKEVLSYVYCGIELAGRKSGSGMQLF